jgi:hypothetical protein
VLQVRVHLDLDWDTLPDNYVLFAIDAAAIVAETIHEPPDDPRAIRDARIPGWSVNAQAPTRFEIIGAGVLRFGVTEDR